MLVLQEAEIDALVVPAVLGIVAAVPAAAAAAVVVAPAVQ